MPNTAAPVAPAVARRRVRLALRSAREKKELTQTDVAKAMAWSLSKVMRIEKGEVNISQNDLKILLTFLSVDNPTQVQRLIDDARVTRQERYTIDPVERDSLTAAMIEFYQFEDEAVAVRAYHNFLVPGRMQTREYSAAITRAAESQFGPRVMSDRLEMRMRRQERLVVPSGPAYYILLDESVLLRRIGSLEVMAGQLAFLRQLTGQSNVQLRILPLSDGIANKYFYGPFQLCDLDTEESAFLYKEDGYLDHAVNTDDEIVRHRKAFDDMWSVALDEPDSLKRIASAMDFHRDQAG